MAQRSALRTNGRAHQRDHSHADQLNKKYEENKTSSDALAGLTSTQRKKQCACGTNEPIQQRRGHLARAHCSSDESKPEQRSCGADHGERGAVETAELKAERGVAAGPNRGHGEGWGRQWLHAERRASSTSADVPGSSSGGLGSEREQYAAGSARCRNPVRRGGMGRVPGHRAVVPPRTTGRRAVAQAP